MKREGEIVREVFAWLNLESILVNLCCCDDLPYGIR